MAKVLNIGLTQPRPVEPLRFTPTQLSIAAHWDDSGGLRQCKTCHQRKSPDEFYLRNKRWPARECKECVKAKLQTIRGTTDGRERKLAASRKYNKSEKNKRADLRYYLKKGRVLTNERRRLRHERVITKYGGMCVCCGETIRAFLHIDHVRNNGNVERRTIPMTKLYKFLDRSPARLSDYQILCANCNLGKHRNGGVCPHEDLMSEVVHCV